MNVKSSLIGLEIIKLKQIKRNENINYISSNW